MAATMDPVRSQVSSPRSTPVSRSATSSTGPAHVYPTPPTTAVDETFSSEDESRRGRSKLSKLSNHEPHLNGAVASAEDDEPPPASPPTVNGHRRTASATSSRPNGSVRRLSAAEMQELTSSPDSLPVAPAPDRYPIDRRQLPGRRTQSRSPDPNVLGGFYFNGRGTQAFEAFSGSALGGSWQVRDAGQQARSPRTVSTPPTTRVQRYSVDGGILQPGPPKASVYKDFPEPPTVGVNGIVANGPQVVPAALSGPTTMSSHQTPTITSGPSPPSPIPSMIPLPPMSLPTHLQLELAAQRPSPLYIHQSHFNDIPYESYAAKLERLKNVLLLPSYLERTLYFGALACLDAWLYTFTILPIRFIIAFGLLLNWWAYVVHKELRWLFGYVRDGLGRLWRRGRMNRSRRPSDVSVRDRSRSCSRVRDASNDRGGVSAAMLRERLQHSRIEPPRLDGNEMPKSSQANNRGPGPKSGTFRHRRAKPMPSSLSAFHKADLLQGAVIICSSFALMTLDASRMYHFIRAQSAIKLYVIYNILEVGDRLLSALGQDILECLFSNETLSRNPSGRSKVLLPLGMFILALIYNCLHSVSLYYQVITLNVAVNSYSNALLTLLLSNQFVEIKSTVFKRFEKDNLFQLTCADIVERFHLWIMLLIIGMRNIVEVGALSVPGAGFDSTQDDGTMAVPLHPPSILPHSFTVLPSWLKSGEVLSPFLIVVGSEMLVDTIKHAYVTKFNNIKPTFYGRTLDILCKDYYTNAFVTPSLTRRLGLAVIPLSCLFIRASVQTYHMFLSTHVSMPLPPSTQTSLTEESAVPSSPAVIAALSRFDALLRDSLGRATYGYPYGSPRNSRPWYAWSSDDMIAALTMVVVFFIAFLILLILKLLLGMLLLQYSRNRYAKMKQREHLIALGKVELDSYETKGRRIGGHGDVEVTDEKQRWIHADRGEGLKGGKGPGGKKAEGKGKKDKEGDYMGVGRYEMVAKRIW